MLDFGYHLGEGWNGKKWRLMKRIFFQLQSSEYGITSNGARITSKRAPRGPIFHIAKVRKEDAGTYICTATNGVGTMSADQIELNVLCTLWNVYIAFKYWILYIVCFKSLSIQKLDKNIDIFRSSRSFSCRTSSLPRSSWESRLNLHSKSRTKGKRKH